MVKKIILVMAEYVVDDSPLWHRGSADLFGTADAGELGLSSHLRRDLREWNNVYASRREPDYAWPSDDVADRHATESFALAARVQLELGDDAHVWCGAGGGIDTVTEAGVSVVLPALLPGTELESWRHGRREIRAARSVGASGLRRRRSSIGAPSQNGKAPDSAMPTRAPSALPRPASCRPTSARACR
jgi:hypothetical protein